MALLARPARVSHSTSTICQEADGAGGRAGPARGQRGWWCLNWGQGQCSDLPFFSPQYPKSRHPGERFPGPGEGGDSQVRGSLWLSSVSSGVLASASLACAPAWMGGGSGLSAPPAGRRQRQSPSVRSQAHLPRDAKSPSKVAAVTAWGPVLLFFHAY
jgi:hypothetical protein